MRVWPSLDKEHARWRLPSPQGGLPIVLSLLLWHPGGPGGRDSLFECTGSEANRTSPRRGCSPLLVLPALSRPHACGSALSPAHRQPLWFTVMPRRPAVARGLGAAPHSSSGYCTTSGLQSLHCSAMRVWQATSGWHSLRVGVALIAAPEPLRGHPPDRAGGARIALIFVLVQAPPGWFLIYWLAAYVP